MCNYLDVWYFAEVYRFFDQNQFYLTLVFHRQNWVKTSKQKPLDNEPRPRPHNNSVIIWMPPSLSHSHALCPLLSQVTTLFSGTPSPEYHTEQSGCIFVWLRLVAAVV